ncbi:hypothetical protein N0V90_008445 [Kalmusia sp. IMI 367209]|nr:hypothetical protein N0V90_008445 [Kalmusia sp. IMI 367209]
MTDTSRVIGFQENPLTGVRTLIYAAKNVCYDPSKAGSTGNTSTAQSPSNLNKAEISAHLKTQLRSCTAAQQAFASAIQHFELNNQLFTSSCDLEYPDGTSDLLATFRAVRCAADELSVPQSAYGVTTSELRVFVGSLIEQLPDSSEVKSKVIPLFNHLSQGYYEKENAIRKKMIGIHGSLEGDARMKVSAYVRMMKERLEVLIWQQENLGLWAYFDAMEDEQWSFDGSQFKKIIMHPAYLFLFLLVLPLLASFTKPRELSIPKCHLAPPSLVVDTSPIPLEDYILEVINSYGKHTASCTAALDALRYAGLSAQPASQVAVRPHKRAYSAIGILLDSAMEKAGRLEEKLWCVNQALEKRIERGEEGSGGDEEGGGCATEEVKHEEERLEEGKRVLVWVVGGGE